jgi:glucose-1-phosphate thymidylyltransferase
LKGLLLAGGHGTRLRPLTYTGNKHMLPIANKPMLLYGLEHLKNAGMTDVGIVLGPVKEGVKELVGDGAKFGVRVEYIDQPEPKGLAHAVMISEDFLEKEPFVMYLGDNLLREGVSRFKQVFEKNGLDCVTGVTPVSNPSSFGVAEVKNGRIISLEEKPKKPRSNLALIGVYVFGPKVFDAIRGLKPSRRGELEITDTIQIMIEQGGNVRAEEVEGWWKDTGRPEDLLEANQLVLADLTTDIKGRLSKKTHSTGRMAVGKGTTTVGSVSIRGPAIIGERCRLGPNVHIGPYTSIGDECTLRNVEVENSIIMKGCRVESGKRIVDSLIGSYSTIADGANSVPQGHRLIVGERSFAQL